MSELQKQAIKVGKYFVLAGCALILIHVGFGLTEDTTRFIFWTLVILAGFYVMGALIALVAYTERDMEELEKRFTDRTG